MCMSAHSTYHPRPVRQDDPQRPVGAPPSAAEADANLFGPKPVPSAWMEAAREVAEPRRAANEIVGVQGAVSSQSANGVIVELGDGTRLLICPV